MPIRFKVFSNRQIIVPVRFCRAYTGAPRKTAPDPDDRGFHMGTKRGTSSTDARGAVVGLRRNVEVELKILYEDIDVNTPLYITSSDPAIAEVVSPAEGSQLGGNGIFKVKGKTARKVCKIQARLGDKDGPILGEMEAKVLAFRQLDVRVIMPTLNGGAPPPIPWIMGHAPAAIPAASARTQNDIKGLFKVANKIWYPTGIHFKVCDWRTPAITLNNTTPATPGKSPGIPAGGIQGCVAIDNEHNNWATQAGELITQNRRAHSVNVHFVRRIYDVSKADGGGTRGLGYSITSASHYGVILADDADANDLAHELGHVLNLDFFGGGKIGHADDIKTQEKKRNSVWIHRRLMYSFNPYGPHPDVPVYRANVSYGNYVRGSLITFKNFKGDPTDGELKEVLKRSSGVLP